MLLQKEVVKNQTEHTAEHGLKAKSESVESTRIEPKCPFGYDSQSFKLSPLSCIICQALLFETSNCVPCSHIFCKIKRSHTSTDAKDTVSDSKAVIYEDVLLERGSFLVQQAMKAFRAQNIQSAKSRLSLCAADIREQLEVLGNKPELCSKLEAVLGMLGDCSVMSWICSICCNLLRRKC